MQISYIILLRKLVTNREISFLPTHDNVPPNGVQIDQLSPDKSQLYDTRTANKGKILNGTRVKRYRTLIDISQLKSLHGQIVDPAYAPRI